MYIVFPSTIAALIIMIIVTIITQEYFLIIGVIIIFAVDLYWIFGGLLTYSLISNGIISDDYFIFPYSLKEEIAIPWNYQRTFNNRIKYSDVIFIKCVIENHGRKQINQYFKEDIKGQISTDNEMQTENILPYIKKSDHFTFVTTKIVFIVKGRILRDPEFLKFMEALLRKV